MTWDDVDRLALALPEVTSEGRSWRIRKKALAWERPLRASDLKALGASAPSGEILGIRTVDLQAKDDLIVAMPEVFFTTPHFAGYPAVLARLTALEPSVLEHLLRDAWTLHAPKRARAPRG